MATVKKLLPVEPRIGIEMSATEARALRNLLSHVDYDVLDDTNLGTLKQGLEDLGYDYHVTYWKGSISKP